MLVFGCCGDSTSENSRNDRQRRIQQAATGVTLKSSPPGSLVVQMSMFSPQPNSEPLEVVIARQQEAVNRNCR